MEPWELTRAKIFFPCLNYAEQKMILLWMAPDAPPVPFVLKVIYEAAGTLYGIPAGSPRYNQLYWVAGLFEIDVPDGDGGVWTALTTFSNFYNDVNVFLKNAPGNQLSNCVVRRYMDEYRR